MTPEQIELIQSSWKKIVPIADTAADLFYDRLFEVAPDVRDLFAEDMAGQKKALLAMLGRVVASLNDLENVVPTVQELGERHVGYGAEPPHYEVVGEVLLWTLEKGLGDLGEEWSDDLKEAWAAAYGVLSSTMIEAANAKIEADRQAEEEEAAHAEAEAKAKAEAEEAKRKEKEEAEARARAEKEAAELKAKQEAEAKARTEQEEAERKAKEEAEEKAMVEKEAAELKAQQEAEAQAESQNKRKKKSRRVGNGSIAASISSGQKTLKVEQASGPHRQLVVFDLDDEYYGLEISAVREIIRLQEITRIPNTPDFVEGVINLRGKVIPVVDLRTRFGMENVERDDDSRVVVVDVNGSEIGMIVDAVTEVSRIPESSIEPPTSVISTDDSEYLAGIAKAGEQMVLLLDIAGLISAEHLEALSDRGAQQMAA
jgi:chemotaxis signal transduction protein/hemoglobin-like flavoprotein